MNTLLGPTVPCSVSAVTFYARSIGEIKMMNLAAENWFLINLPGLINRARFKIICQGCPWPLRCRLSFLHSNNNSIPAEAAGIIIL